LLLVCIAMIPAVMYTSLLDFRMLPRGLFLGVMLLLMYGFWTLAPSGLPDFRSFLRTRPLWPFAGMLAGYSIAAISAFNPVEALFWIQKSILFLLLALAVVAMIGQGVITLLRVSAAVSASIIVAWIMLAIELYPFDFQNISIHDLSTPFGHKNLFASYLVLAAPFVAYLFTQVKTWPLRSAVVLMGILMFITILLLQAKTALIALVVGGSLISVIVLQRYPVKTRYWVAGIAVTLAAAGIMVLFRFDGTFYTLRSGSWDERQLVWRNTLQMIADYPVFGVGGGNWQIFFPRYGLHDFFGMNDKIYQGYETFQRPHNDYLWVYAEAGIAGFLAWISILLLPLWRFWKQRGWRRSAFHPQNLMLAGLVSYFVLAGSDFSLERFEHQMLMVLLFVFVVQEILPERDEKECRSNMRVVPLIGLLFSVLIVFGLYSRLKGEHNHFRVLQAHSAGQWTQMAKWSQTTNTAVYNIDNFSIPVRWYEGVARFALGDQPGAFNCFREANEVNPWQVHVLNNLAGSYQQQGNPEQALVIYEKALEIAPLHYEVLLNKSITAYNLGRTDDAFRTMLRLIHKREHPPAYHQAMPVIINAWLRLLKEDTTTGKWNQESIDNLIRSDSLKTLLLYHYQIDKRPLDELINTFLVSVE
jgi:O-antigen ligase